MIAKEDNCFLRSQKLDSIAWSLSNFQENDHGLVNPSWAISKPNILFNNRHGFFRRGFKEGKPVVQYSIFWKKNWLILEQDDVDALHVQKI